MTEKYSVTKSSVRSKRLLPASTPKSFLGNNSFNDIKQNRLSLLPTLKDQKATSSLDSFISEVGTSDNSDYKNYQLEYGTYLLRKLQNKILKKNNVAKEENIKKCFVILKLEYEDLLNKCVRLSKDICYLNMCFEVIEESSNRIELGKSILQALKENNLEVVVKSLSDILDGTVNQLELVNIDKNLIDAAFNNNILGPNSELEKILMKIYVSAEKNKDVVSDISKELKEIEKISLENSDLRKKCFSMIEEISTDILETSFEKFTDIVKKVFEKREESRKNESESHIHELFHHLEELFKIKLQPTVCEQLNTFSILKLESSYSESPKCTSTPHSENK